MYSDLRIMLKVENHLELSVQLYNLEGPPGCTNVFLSPDGETAYFVDQSVTMLDITTRKVLRVFSTLRGVSRASREDLILVCNAAGDKLKEIPASGVLQVESDKDP